MGNLNHMTMGDPKKYEKYKRFGGYHWMWYDKRYTYRTHADFLKRWVNEKSVLDIGAGDGFITHFLGIRGVDNDPYGIKAAARKGVTIDLGDAYSLPYKDEEFDSALMSDTIEHFSNVDLALSEARRVIKKFLYVNIPLKERFVEPDHYGSWTPEQFTAQVEKQGFALVDGPRLKPHRNRGYFKFQKK